MSARPHPQVSAITPQSFTTFGELLRYLRERAELSQRELALQVGYHYSYMSRIEKSERIPDSAALMARFVPALYLDDEPEWTARLLKLATASEGKASSQTASPAESSAPPTTLPIFDLSAGNLPTILTPLLGRDNEVIALSNLLTRNNVRLVTVIGPPGVGKTRLVTHIAAQMAGSFAHGAVFVDLTQAIEPKDFLPALAEALSIYEIPEIPIMTRLVNALRQKNLLLVIDNFEQVIDAAPQVLQLLGKIPEIKVLVTSREALRLSGENEFTVAPFPLPQKPPTVQPIQSGEAQMDELMTFAAIQLFTQRAQAVQLDFQLTSENMDAVLEMCRRLDGLPLAIELAAARVKILTPQAMLSQFDRHLDWLAHGTRDSQAWRQTLRGAIEWSYNLLSEPERILMYRLSVFSDGWTAESAEAICGDDEVKENPLLRRGEILDLLIQLADKSLVNTNKMENETRFQFLETIHNFAREKLEGSGEETQVKNRHLAYFAGFAEEAEIHIYGTDQGRWTASVEEEHANIRAALDWGLHADASLRDGLRLVAAVSRFWIRRSFFREGLEWLTAYLQRAVGPSHDLVRTKILYRAGAAAAYMFDYTTASRLCQQSMDLARALGNKRYLAAALFYMSEIALGLGRITEARTALEECVSLCWADYYPQLLNLSLSSLGMVLDMEGDHEGAQSTLEEALAIARLVDDNWGTSHVLHNLGAVNRYRQKYDEASDYMERSLEVTLKIGDRRAAGIIYANLSILYNLKDNYAQSEDCAEKAFAIFQSIGDEFQQPFPLRMMGYAAIHARNLVRARVLIQESLKDNRGLEDIPGQLACLVAFAKCALEDKDAKNAISLCALIETRMEVDGVQLLEPDVKALQEVLTQGKKKLGKAIYESAYKEGGAMKLDDEIMKLLMAE
jgi:predicted ATPase/transcriptional regulator with XRE-family HTH domain